MDMLLNDDGSLVLVGAARDLRTTASGVSEELAAAQLKALVGKSRLLEDLEVAPDADTGGLLGLPVAGGFRAAVDQAVPRHRALHSPLYLLLDEMPVATLISGYATLYRGGVPASRIGEESVNRSMLRADICAGWRSDGLMMTAVASDGRPPTPIGPTAPVLERPDDPLAWHTIPQLPVGAMRRRRLIDVASGGRASQVYAMFRDTHVDQGGDETVLHEYELEMEVDADTMLVRRCHATPRTLPWPECPAAAASAPRLVGHTVGELRALVRTDFRGTSTCTHLNDLLRSLADVTVLVEALD
jgi:hypothetical protein